MTQQGNPLEISLRIAVTVETSSIESAFHAVVANQTGHVNRVQRTLGQKRQSFIFLGLPGEVAPADQSSNCCVDSRLNSCLIIVTAMLLLSSEGLLRLATEAGGGARLR